MEVSAKIRFVTPCLGNERRDQRDLMLRNSDGYVIFLQSWWRCSLRYAANAIGRWQRDADEIQADPVVRGQTSIYRRFWNSNQYKEHESFLAGSVVEVNFLLPSTLGIDEFRQILTTAGRYAGLSPYGYKQDFGRFELLELVRRVHVQTEGHHHPVGQSDQDSAAVQGTVSQEVVVQSQGADGR